MKNPGFEGIGNGLIQLIQERIGSVASEFDVMDLTPEPLSKLKGVRGETTLLYARLKQRQGIYFILENENLDSIVYVGRTDDGGKEYGLADRLWAHLFQESHLRTELSNKGIDLDKCFVVTLEVPDRKKRIRLEHLFIGVFNPVANIG